MLVRKQRFDRVIDILFLVSAFLLVVGTPLVFTSLTRSVFEVNKLLLLRVLTLFTYGLWFFKYLAYKNNPDASDEDNTAPVIKTRFFTWKKMGLEIPIILWILVNIVSTIFSQNLKISLIGAYDRWEGIITVINYVLLIIMFAKTLSKRFQLNWVIAGIIGSTALSSLYGVLQSLGFDFMNWSQDPTYRVFACINNPVHYCAYVAMVVPLCLGTLLLLSSKKSNSDEPKTESIFSTFNISILIIALVLLKLFAFPSSYDWGIFGLCSIATILAWIVSILSPNCIPTKKEAGYWLGLVGLLAVSLIFNWFDFSREQWFGYGVALMSFFVLTGNTKDTIFKRFIFVLTLLIFYTQVLSFSRATWVGFLMSMPFFYLLASKRFASQTSKTFMGDVIATAIGLFSFTLIQTFKVFSSSFTAGIAFSIAAGAAFLYSFFLIRNEESDSATPKNVIQIIISTVLLILLSGNILNDIVPSVSEPIRLSFSYIVLAFFIFFSTTLKGSSSRFIERLVLIVFFAHIQLAGKSFFDLMMHLSLALSYYLIGLKGTTTINRESKFWLLGFALLSGICVLLPSVSGMITGFEEFVFANAFYITASLLTGLLLYGILLCYLIWGASLVKKKSFQLTYCLFSLSLFALVLIFNLNVNKVKALEIENAKGLAVASTIQRRSQAYGGQFEHSARMSMWKSAIPWFKDYFLIGSGPDTIKYMYPVYRRPEYGILEGGHNFTPDRLHNEYINTLVTRGSLGFITYYGGIILTWLGIVLFWIYRNPNNPYRFIAAGATVGACIYLGQVLFNFGVVATLVMFYVLMGIGLAIRMHSEFQNDQNEA